jgi:hypothetical protein
MGRQLYFIKKQTYDVQPLQNTDFPKPQNLGEGLKASCDTVKLEGGSQLLQEA